MILMIDNYDSFTYNLVHCVAQFGQEVIVRRNDSISLEEIRNLRPTAIFHFSRPPFARGSGNYGGSDQTFSSRSSPSWESA